MRCTPRRLNSSGVATCGAGRWRSARAPLRLRVVDDGEQVAADAVHRRLDDGEDGRRGDGGVDGVAAVLQDAQPRRGRQRLARGDMPLRASTTDRGRARIPGRRSPGPCCASAARSGMPSRTTVQRTTARIESRITHLAFRNARPRSRIPESPNPRSRFPSPDPRGAPIEPHSGENQPAAILHWSHGSRRRSRAALKKVGIRDRCDSGSARGAFAYVPVVQSVSVRGGADRSRLDEGDSEDRDGQQDGNERIRITGEIEVQHGVSVLSPG